MSNMFEDLSTERKKIQEKDQLPEWFTTHGWQLFKSKYLYQAEGLNDTYRRIAKTAARHLPKNRKRWENKFYDLMWKGYLACSTPVLANMGTDRGCPVSCSGQLIGDSIYNFYENRLETAVLTKNGFGTSAYLGDIRARGTEFNGGGKTSGTLPVFKMFIQDMRDVSQGNSRRGAWAGYLPLDHKDFWEVSNYILNYPDDLNIGWNVSDEFIERLDSGDKEAIEIYQRAMKIRAVTGKGYFFFPDKANKLNPSMYIQNNLSIKASNLCTEVMLHSDEDHTYTCVLSSMNLYKYDEWKDTDAVFTATVFLDCVAQEFIEIGKTKRGLEKAVRFTEKGRALGLGLLGFHSYLQSKSIPFESLEAHLENTKVFIHLNEESLRASKWMAEELGEPEWCKGHGVRNTHRLAVAPNTSSALICGGVSQGIEPVVANVYTQPGAAGELDRINPVLIELLQKKGQYTPEVLTSISEKLGSVQHLDFLSDHEKLVFKTAYEIDQKAVIRLASARQQYIDQGQSLNLFFAADEDEAYISEVHQLAFKDPMIKSLYYMRSLAGVQASKDECEACSG